MNVTAHPAKMGQRATTWRINTRALVHQDIEVLTVNRVSTYYGMGRELCFAGIKL